MAENHIHVKMEHYMINETQYTVIWFFIYTTYRKKNNTLVTLNPIYIYTVVAGKYMV